MDIKAELKIFDKWIFDNMPIQNLDINILCTYVEGFRIPFKFDSEKLISYNKLIRLKIRDDEFEMVDRLVNEGVSSVAEAVGSFPDSFIMKKAKSIIKNKKFDFEHSFINMPIGKSTGRYYFDPYGYCWFEVNGHYMSDRRQIIWVRETSINYEGKESIQDLINGNRQVIEDLRLGAEKKNSNSKILAFLTLGLSILQSK